MVSVCVCVHVVFGSQVIVDSAPPPFGLLCAVPGGRLSTCQVAAIKGLLLNIGFATMLTKGTKTHPSE